MFQFLTLTLPCHMVYFKPDWPLGTSECGPSTSSPLLRLQFYSECRTCGSADFLLAQLNSSSACKADSKNLLGGGEGQVGSDTSVKENYGKDLSSFV